MTRLDAVLRSATSPAQEDLWDLIESTRGGTLVGPDGGLVGPFNAMMTSPTVGSRVAELGGAIRHSSSLPDNLLEIVIVTVGAHWRSNFEFWAHRRLALRAGVDEQILDAIEAGDVPAFSDEAEAAVHTLVRELVATGRVSAATYAEASAHLTAPQLVDAVFTAGYYCLISLTLNTFEVPLPDGADPIWDD